MITRVCKSFQFDAAHLLPGYPGDCKNLHGHTWRLEVTYSGPVDEKTGMVADFAGLKALVNKEIIKYLDHTYLNDLIENPTCENILDWIWCELVVIRLIENTRLVKLRLYETPDSYAEVGIDN